MPNFRKGRSGGSRPVRPMDWECAQFDTSGLIADSISCDWVVLPSVMRERYTDPTLMASRWFFNGLRGVGGQVGAGFIGVGIIAWDSQLDTPPADCPDPLVDCDLDWINRWVHPVASGAGTTQITLFGPQWDNVHLSKAKRRLGNQSSILYVASSINSTVVVNVAADVRLLIKE